MAKLSFAASVSISLFAANVLGAAIKQLPRADTSPYAPVSTSCPDTALVRTANSASSSEADYVTERKSNADTALAAWLKDTDSGFDTTDLPIIGLTSSGGGYRALLNGGGVVKGFDSRDTDNAVSGIYQALTYHAGLSGGGWLLSSISGNDWPTISYLQSALWEEAFQDSALDPSALDLFSAYGEIVDDIAAKQNAGFDPTIVDPYGRLLSYQLLEGDDGGVLDRLSGLTDLSNFTSHK